MTLSLAPALHNSICWVNKSIACQEIIFGSYLIFTASFAYISSAGHQRVRNCQISSYLFPETCRHVSGLSWFDVDSLSGFITVMYANQLR